MVANVRRSVAGQAKATPNAVGINFLEKIQLPHLPSIYGAMLAGVDYVLMGAGIPMKIPGVLDHFAKHEPATYPLTVSGADEPVLLSFDPREFVGGDRPPLKRPQFLAIIASDVLALSLTRRANGAVNGFIVEGPTAGGHNAPPRGARQVNDRGEPVYGPRDVVNLEKLKALGLPFWLAGGAGTADRVREALAAGATGVQVGTAFAMCAESGLRDDLRQTLLAQVRDGASDVMTNAVASPTGFPFKVATVADSLSDAGVLAARPRICDLGYLRDAYQEADGTIGFRCPGEPIDAYLAKGGRREDTVGRRCLCNELIATVGLGQRRDDGAVEPPLVTSGDELLRLGAFLAGRDRYAATDVIDYLGG
jgi:nitronate monooxygenase